MLTRLPAALAALVLLTSCASTPPAPRADHHQHVFSPAVAAMLAAENVPLGERSGRNVIAMLDAAGIGRAVLLSTAYMYGSPSRKIEDEAEKVKAANDWAGAEAARYPGRLIAFCGFNPLKDYALAELERCARDPRLRHGIKLHLGNSDVQLQDPAHVEKLRAVFRAANEHRMAIAVHVRASISRKRPYGPEQARVFLEQLLPLVPDVPVQIAHLAGTGPGYDDEPADQAMAFLAGAVRRGDPRTRNLWFDVSGIVNAETTEAELARMAERMRHVGLERLVYGSDASAPPREAWAAFRRLPLTEEELARIARNVAPYFR